MTLLTNLFSSCHLSQVNKGARPKTTTTTAQKQAPVPLSNAFNVLPVEQVDPEVAGHTKRVSNVYVKSTGRALMALLDKRAVLRDPESYRVKHLSAGRVTIKARNRKIQEEVLLALEAEQLGHHYFPDKSEAPVKMVLEGLCEFKDADVMRMLLESELLEVKPTLVVRMKRHDKDSDRKVDTRLFVVTFPAGTKLQQLKGVTHLERVCCQFRDLYKSTRLCHCSNCQDWGHLGAGCRRPSRCVKCSQFHKSKDCHVILPDSPRTLLQCVCGETGHPANYSKCRLAIEYQRRLEKQASLLAKSTGAAKQHYVDAPSPVGSAWKSPPAAAPQPRSSPEEEEVHSKSPLTDIVELLQQCQRENESLRRILSKVAMSSGVQLNDQEVAALVHVV